MKIYTKEKSHLNNWLNQSRETAKFLDSMTDEEYDEWSDRSLEVETLKFEEDELLFLQKYIGSEMSRLSDQIEAVQDTPLSSMTATWIVNHKYLKSILYKIS